MCSGVLDAEELSSIIEGVEKEALPRIEEDVYKSCDSISTLESDSLTLESVEMEGDLFEDVRASIQKSSKKSNLSGENTKVPSPASGLQGFQTRDRKSLSALCLFSTKGVLIYPQSIKLMICCPLFFSFQKGWHGFSRQCKSH